ncbi:MAG TPA: hypothetical protein VM433_12535 [Mycobacteriales bacterium]|nr:hypothetical protein [Mycobacteriales bacterium]
MTRDEALKRLAAMTAATSRPVLSDEDLGALLDQYAVVDPEGRAPQDDGWTGAWLLNPAAAEGWRWKAGRVAGDFTFSADDARYDKGSVLANCERMVALYAAKDVGVIGPRADASSWATTRLMVSG